MIYDIVVLSDVHIGALNPTQLLSELQLAFFDNLDDINIDAIIITGDLFDSKLSMNSSHVKMAFVFLNKLFTVCRDRGCKLRIIKGTESHDNKQLDILSMINMDIDFKVISTVESEYLFKDLRVLYVPEEYVKDPEEYYKSYFSEEYDMIFGHGMIREVSFSSHGENNTNYTKSPIFNSSDLLSICRGPIFFGHIHKMQRIKDRFYYVGSFSRWCFGEDEEKGFFSCGYDTNDYSHTPIFIVNEYAKKYDTLIIPSDSSIFNDIDFDKINTFISNINTDMNKNIRMIINMPEDCKDPLLITNIFYDIGSKYGNLKIKIISSTDVKKNNDRKERINQLLEKYDFVFNSELTYEDKLVQYIKVKYDKHISLEKLNSYLYES